MIRLDKYEELIGRIGRGAMAEVYVANALGLSGFSKKVALKVLFSFFTEDAESVAMFTEEAKLVALLVHPHIVQVHEFGKAAGRYFIAMEHIDGADLASVQHAAGALPVAAAVAIIADALAGLHYAHELCGPQGEPLGVVHRDVSPSNILIAKAGVVKVTDFGVAKVAARNAKTRTGLLKGKFAYMAPEQASGTPVDRRADIFSAALLAAELLSGAPVYRGETEFEILAQAQAGKIGELSVPPALEPVLRKALATNRADRHDSALDFSHALQDAAARSGHPRWDEAALAAFVGARVQPTAVTEVSEEFFALESMPVTSPRRSASRWWLAPAALMLVAGGAFLTRLQRPSPRLSSDSAPLEAPTSLPVSPPLLPASNEVPKEATKEALPKPERKLGAAYGYLSVNSSPWSRVWVDGRLAAVETPLQQYRLKVGKHTLTLVATTGQKKTVEVEIKEGATTNRIFNWDSE